MPRISHKPTKQMRKSMGKKLDAIREMSESESIFLTM